MQVIVEKVGEHAGKSRGFGFVIYERKEDSEEAIRVLHESEIEGRKVDSWKPSSVEFTSPGADHSQSCD